MAIKSKLKHIILTSHPGSSPDQPVKINWGATNPEDRGPVIAVSATNSGERNAIGSHSGSYAIYRALAVAAGALDPDHRPDLTDTSPTHKIGPHPSWGDPKKIVSMDPYGHIIQDVFSKSLASGIDIRPTIAITQAHIQIPEFSKRVADGRIKADGKVVKKNGDIVVTKAAIEPVWYLPGIAERFKCKLPEMRRALFEFTGGMYPELITRPDIQIFLPPIGGSTLYMMGDVDSIPNPKIPLTVRVHDECNGSDVFGSDICTCRPYLVHGIELAIETAQQGGAGLIVYNRKEGRALGEVTKFLVYNARKRQAGGDNAAKYFVRTECVAGVQDMRFQELMPDVLHWLGISKIDRFVSMSNMKYNAVTGSGIEIVERVTIPDEMIPEDARVEMEAKKAAGYFTQGGILDERELTNTKGRKLNE